MRYILPLVAVVIATTGFVASSRKEMETFVNSVHPKIAKRFENIQEKQNGLSRIPRRGPHLMFIAGTNEAPKEFAKENEVMLLLGGAKTARLTKDNLKMGFAGWISGPKDKKNVNASLEKLQTLTKDVAKKNLTKATTLSKEGWTLFTKPIFASQKACYKCHTSSKEGDSLGVLVYAIRSK